MYSDRRVVVVSSARSLVFAVKDRSGLDTGPKVNRKRQARRSSAKGVTTITLLPVEERSKSVDVGAQGESVGDFFLFEETLYNTNGRKVGRDAVRCEIGIRTYTCEATFQLDGRGKVRVDGTFFGPNENLLPVTGGTKDFRNASGQLRILEQGGKEFLVLELVR